MILRYPGSKLKLRSQIIGLAPSTYGEYREPFAGGASVFFGIEKDVRRWINDADSQVVAVYTALRDRPADFIRQCQSIPPLRPGEPQDRLKAVFREFAGDIDADPALRYFFLSRASYGGMVDRPCTNPEDWSFIYSPILWTAASILQNAKITSGDYLPLFQAPGHNVWIYADPPYYVNNELPESRRLYRHHFSHQQHVEFAEHARACSHRPGGPHGR